MASPHDFSHAFPRRLFLSRDAAGLPCHVLAGEVLRPGTLLLLQLDDSSWIPGVYEWTPPLGDESPSLPVLRIFLRSPESGSHESPLKAELALPPEAVLRVHPSWRRTMSPRSPRRPRRRP